MDKNLSILRRSSVSDPDTAGLHQLFALRCGKPFFFWSFWAKVARAHSSSTSEESEYSWNTHSASRARWHENCVTESLTNEYSCAIINGSWFSSPNSSSMGRMSSIII